MARVILHADLDAFFVAVEQALNPALRGLPVVVGGEPGGRGVVASASYEARAYGIHSAMPLAEARRHCPQAIFLPGRFDRYADFSERFMAVLADLTPDLEPRGLDEAFLDLTGFEPLYGPPRETARRLKEKVRQELGLVVSVGIASNKTVAKVASDVSKPDGLLEVPSGQEAIFLAPLPVGALPTVGGEAERRLKAIGIYTIGQLAALPAAALEYHFGVWGRTMALYARGCDSAPVVSEPAPPKSIGRSTTLAADSSDTEVLEALLCYLGERVGAALRREGKWARRVTIAVRYADFRTVSRSRTLKEPVESDVGIFEPALELLRQALREHWDRVRLVGVSVSDLMDGGFQRSLWQSVSERHGRLSAALDRLRERYGFTSIQRGRTACLSRVLPQEHGAYVLKTPSLSR
jgi:DNA polymerase-4